MTNTELNIGSLVLYCFLNYRHVLERTRYLIIKPEQTQRTNETKLGYANYDEGILMFKHELYLTLHFREVSSKVKVPAPANLVHF